uniref:Pre-60S ribosomal particles component n=1 Tax=Sphaerodactylus townsendi TaxID=933632 RepID=A0ACB8GA02_9SAUR
MASVGTGKRASGGGGVLKNNAVPRWLYLSLLATSVTLIEQKGSEQSSGLLDDSFSSGAEELEGEEENEPAILEDKDKIATKSKDAANTGWADAMAKVLHKTVPKNKHTILVKNKERDKEREREKQKRLEKRKQLDKKREWEEMCRVKPDVVKDREAERDLQRIATRGVVQLFNAVRKHQRNVEEKAKETGSSDRKRAKLISSVSKRDFINVLRGMEGTEMDQNTVRKSVKSKQKLLLSLQFSESELA